MTALRYHDRTRALGDVAAADALVLVACFGQRDLGSPNDHRRAAELLSSLRDKQSWLECQCRTDAVDPKPLMSPRLREGQIHIWRHGVTPHTPGCPFFVVPSERDTSAQAPGGTMAPWDGGWLLLKQMAADTSDRNTPTTSRSPSPKAAPTVPALARLLFSILTDTGYTTVAPGDVVTRRDHAAVSRGKEAYAALASIQEQKVAPNLTWRDVGCTYLPGLPNHLGKLAKLAPRFPSGVRPQGLFLGVVSAITPLDPHRSQLEWRGQGDRVAVVNVEGTVRRSGFEKGTSGPYWVIAQLAQQRAGGPFLPVHAYAHPVLSRSVLLAVDSGLERIAAEALLRQINYWASENGPQVSVQLEKPLFPEEVGDGLYCHPDFVLWLPDRRRILIEVMGMEKDPDYLASKAITHPRMRALPGVLDLVEFRPEDDPFAFGRRLTALILKYKAS